MGFGLWALSCPTFADAQETRPMEHKTTQEREVQHYIDVADNYMKFLTEKNLEGILSLYAEDATVEDPVGSEIVSGKKALRKFYGGAVKMDLVLKRTGPVRYTGGEAAFPFRLWMEVDGEATVTDIIDVFKFDDEGKIISMRAYWGMHNRSKVE